MVRWQQKRQNLFVFFLLRPVLSLHSFVAFLYTATKLIYSSVYAVLKLVWDFVSRKFVLLKSSIKLIVVRQFLVLPCLGLLVTAKARRLTFAIRPYLPSSGDSGIRKGPALSVFITDRKSLNLRLLR